MLTGALNLPGLPSQQPGAAASAHYISYDQARPILNGLKEFLPAELRTAGPDSVASVWQNWVARHDAEIRARLVQGDEDSLVNFLLFGTSFTRNPRVTLKALTEVRQKEDLALSNAAAASSSFTQTIDSRVDDLIRAMVAPRGNERVAFARRVLESKGYRLDTDSSRAALKNYLLANLARVLKESSGYARALESARLLGDSTEEFIARSKLYRNRGLSLDTSLLPNMAVEKSLEAMKARGLLSTGSMRRVAIIGPGLDFTDKQDGYDFYPQQTIQSFALIDSLLRLGLARVDRLQLTTFDLSRRVNDHLGRARQRARQGLEYVVQLPRDPQAQWKREAVDYWSRFGDRIGTPTPPVAIPSGMGDLTVRAVRIRPTVISLVKPKDLNIVLQRLDLPASERFDLIVATNIFVYYDVFDQSLALANVESMLRSGGFLLSNNALLELPGSGMHSVGYETVVYSDRPNDGDHIVWYQRAR